MKKIWITKLHTMHILLTYCDIRKRNKKYRGKEGEGQNKEKES